MPSLASPPLAPSLVAESPPAAPLVPLNEAAEDRVPRFPGVRHPVRSAAWCIQIAFGLASLLVLLALIAAVPLVNFLALGYLLEAEGRVARTGRLRDGFPLISIAPRLGSIALGVWLWLLPLRLIATQADAAQVIDPGSPTASRWEALQVIAAVAVGLHLCLALARGGSPGCFVRPIKNLRWLVRRIRSGGYFDSAAEEIARFWRRLRIREHFSLGARGFGPAAAWLALPTLIYASVRDPGGMGGLQMLAGGAFLMWVFAWMPCLQCRFAAEDRWGATFELREMRELFRHAPIAWLLAMLTTYVLALPLYLFKAFLLPQDALWPIALVFVASIYPTRLVSGWAYARALRRRSKGRRAHWATRTAVRLLGIYPLVAAYVFLLYFTQFLGIHGKLTLIEHHVFLLPWPYLIGVGG